jgi:hypothetical protein
MKEKSVFIYTTTSLPSVLEKPAQYAELQDVKLDMEI